MLLKERVKEIENRKQKNGKAVFYEKSKGRKKGLFGGRRLKETGHLRGWKHGNKKGLLIHIEAQ